MGEAELRDVHQGQTERIRWKRRPLVRVSGRRGSTANEGADRRRPGAQTSQGARVHCRDQRARPGGAAQRRGAAEPGAESARRARRVLDRGVAGRHRLVLPQRLLPDARGLRLRDCRRDASRVRGDRGRRRHAADRLSRSGDGSPLAVQGPRPRRFSRADGAECRGAQPSARERCGRAGPDALMLGQLSGSAPLRRAAPGPHRCAVEGEAARHPVRGGESAPRSRVGTVRDGQAAGGEGADPRRHRVPVPLHRASRAGRAAYRAVCEARRPRQRDGRRRLRLQHSRRIGRRGSGGRLGEARIAVAGRRHRKPHVLAASEVPS